MPTLLKRFILFTLTTPSILVILLNLFQDPINYSMNACSRKDERWTQQEKMAQDGKKWMLSSSWNCTHFPTESRYAPIEALAIKIKDRKQSRLITQSTFGVTPQKSKGCRVKKECSTNGVETKMHLCDGCANGSIPSWCYKTKESYSF